jgi:hypothetical protein
VQRLKLEEQFLDGYRRLGGKGFLNDSWDSLSIRISGTAEMLLAAGLEDWRDPRHGTMRTQSFTSQEPLAALHGSIYRRRSDVGAVAISSPPGTRILAKSGGTLPPLFDEQVRHIGLPSRTPLDKKALSNKQIDNAFKRGANAALLSDRLICLGMTCERVVFNTELFEKCARSFVIARASGINVGVIPSWVRLIANHRLMRDERNAAARYRNGELPESTTTY